LIAKLGGPPVFVRVKLDQVPEEHRAKWATMQDPVARVRNAIYGLQRSFGDWKNTLEEIFDQEIQSKKIDTEDSVYMIGDVTITVYVDDLIIDDGGDPHAAEAVRKKIESKLPIKFQYIKDDPRFLGINIDIQETKNGDITISLGQTEYATVTRLSRTMRR